MTQKAMRTIPGALSLVDQALHLLRRNNFAALAEYYLGTLPFVLALLYFWSDMSSNPMAVWYCGPSSAGVALLFIWMKMCQVRYCRRLWCHLQKVEPEPWTWKRTLFTAARQTALHATGAVLLPLSFLLAIPFGWVYAFYQNVCVVDDPSSKDLKGLTKAARAQAVLWPGQNHLMLGAMIFFGLFVFLNLAVGMLIVPHLLKALLGIDTIFTLSGIRMLNTTFLAVLCGFTYLCMDPILKAIYVLRCFFGASLQTGDDLKSALRPFLSTGFTAVIIFLAAIVPNCWAGDDGAVSIDPWQTVEDLQAYVDELDGHIESVLEQRRFAWRIPREEVPKPDAELSWIGETLLWIGQKTRAFFRTIGGWIEAIFEWFFKKLPKPELRSSGETGNYREMIRWVFYSFGTGLALCLIWWLVRWLKNSRPVPDAADPQKEAPGDVDLTDERVTAEDLPLDRWLALARELADSKDFRKALRALYLSVLALLADHQRVTIAPYKSNQDYARELVRRAHSEPELMGHFNWCVGAFERSWYGMHPVGKPLLDAFVDHQERLTALVQPTA